VADLRALLGLQQGGRQALLAAAVLSGGDYNADGAQRVGVLSALRVVAHLLQGEQVGGGGARAAPPGCLHAAGRALLRRRHQERAPCRLGPPPQSPPALQPWPRPLLQDDGQVLLRLALALRQGPDRELERLTKCTGCKACKHDSGRSSGSCKEHPRTKGCAACGTSSGCVPRPDARWARLPPPARGPASGCWAGRCTAAPQAHRGAGLPAWRHGSAPRRAVPALRPPAPTPGPCSCECRFCASEAQRLLNRVVARAEATPDFRAAFLDALTCWEEQHRAAAAHAARLVADGTAAAFAWARRPDEGAVAAVLERWAGAPAGLRPGTAAAAAAAAAARCQRGSRNSSCCARRALSRAHGSPSCGPHPPQGGPVGRRGGAPQAAAAAAGVGRAAGPGRRPGRGLPRHRPQAQQHGQQRQQRGGRAAVPGAGRRAGLL
jgi:hypothetical protein